MNLEMRPISLGLRSNPARHRFGGVARLVNCYAEELGEEGKTPWNVHACDGFDDFSTLTDGGSVRAMMALSDADGYAVAGRLLFRVDGTGTASVLGGISSDGMVTMARNRAAAAQIAVVCDGLYYKVQGGVLTPLTVDEPHLPSPISVDNLNGYFIFMLSDGRMFSSELDDTNVLATDFATASSKPDGGVRAWVRGQELLAGGPASIEVWADQGGSEFPLGRVTNVKRAEDDKDIGVLSGQSVAESYFVGSDKTVRELRGYQAVKISGPKLHDLIERETSPNTIRGFTWEIRGHTFYAVSGTDWTWCYDSSTKLWHERESYDNDGRWKIGAAMPFANGVVLGDIGTNKLYRLGVDTYTEAGSHLVVSVTTPPLQNGGKPFRLHRVELDVEPGVGLVSATESLADPQIMVAWSRDGQNFSTERTRSMGRAGQSMAKVFATGLGLHDQVSLRFSCSAPVKRAFYGCRVGMG